MVASSPLSYFWIAAIVWTPTFVCASLLRAKGISGILGLIGLASVTTMIFIYFRDAELAIAAIAALAGLGLGGRLSDRLEHKRLKRIQQAEMSARQASMRSR